MTSLLLTLLTLASPAHAALSCSGTVNLPGGFLNGTCTASSCSVFANGGYLSGSGNCGGSVMVEAQGYKSGSFVSGQCTGGSLSLFLNGEEVSLRGTCSNGHAFLGYAQTYGGMVSGTCMVNGTFNVFIPGEVISFQGTCQ